MAAIINAVMVLLETMFFVGLVGSSMVVLLTAIYDVRYLRPQPPVPEIGTRGLDDDGEAP